MADSCEKNYVYLDKIHSPADIKELDNEAILVLAEEIRRELVSVVTENGGHLASNLGVVELTLAIHKVFDSPRDHIIFDVGHQSYVHKMLTGRLDRMNTLRKAGGLSGFTKRDESEHDCFGAGHSSTSLSAALGFAMSDKLRGSDAYTVAVIGDGAYTGGMIHEALNNCRKDINLVIIVNENEMSISKNIGRFAKNLSKIRNKSGYFKTKKATGAFLKHIPLVGRHMFRFVRAVKKSIKNMLYGSNYFENMGLTYLGPVDGNNYPEVEGLLREAVKLGESVVVHIKTKKGKGYAAAENAPEIYHGMSPSSAEKSEKQNFSRIMGDELLRLAEKDDSVCAITAAMGDGTGLARFRERFEKRFFDVGIAEEHAMTFSAALAANGMKPFFAVYSSFLQRAYDNVIHDVALQGLPVKILVDRAGINASDGATHHGIFDVAFLSQIPNMKIYVPITEASLRAAVDEAYAYDAPCAIRYPNGVECERVVREFYPSGVDGRLSARRNYTSDDAPECVIVTHGRIVTEALAAADLLREKGISVGVILLEVLKPYGDTADTVAAMLPKGGARVIFLEEEIRNGGMGMILSDNLSKYPEMKNKSVSVLAVDDDFVHRKEGESIYSAAHVSAEDIIRAYFERDLG
ncbi:MAG: 1-deoxy-D-xylulose-5-phosphate synthase [Ruminococcaceae bacterium]|nr:1-deoxy-D-xylulose-5-phosphate synthase [Oscillospiraceae bacterium]